MKRAFAAAFPRSIIFAIAILALAATPASAQTLRTWNVTTGTWSETTSWNGGVAAGASDTASFSGSGAGTGDVTVLLSSATSVGGMSFSSGTTVLRSNAGSARTLTLGTSGITMANSAGPVTIGVSGSQVNLVLNGTQTFTNNFTSASGKVFTIAGTVNTAGSVGSTLTVAGSGSTTISGVISGSAGREIAITKTGAGVLTLSGNNTYSGTTTISQGKITLSHANALGSTAAGTIVASGAQLFVQANNSTIPENFTISGVGLATSGAGNGALGMQINSGVVTYSGTVTLDNGATIGTFNAGVATMTINNGIAGTGDLHIRSASANNGAATWRLLGQSSYTGNTQFSTVNVSGTATVQNGVNNALPTGTVLTMSGTSATNPVLLNYRLFGFNQTLAGLSGGVSGTSFANIITGGSSTLSTLTINNAANFTYAGSLGGAATNDDNLALVKSGTGTQTLSGNNSYAGATDVLAGGLIINGTHSGVGLASVANGAWIGGTGSLAGGLTIAAGGLFVFNPANPTLDVLGSVSLDNSFSVASLVNSAGTGIDWGSVADSTYSLIGLTSSTFNTIANFGSGSAANIGGGRTAYFTNASESGGLNLVVVPEPTALALAGLGIAAAAWVRRRRT